MTDARIPRARCDADPADLEQRNRIFNEFLEITPDDQALVRKYREALSRHAGDFARRFYDYLLSFEPTANVLSAYESEGGDIRELVRRQQAHFLKLLSADTDYQSAYDLCRIGRIHFQRDVEPAWVMGAYRLYLDHLQEETRRVAAPTDAKALDTALGKILMRDMGLMLEGYWLSAMEQIGTEQDRAAALQSQIENLLANLPQILWSVDTTTNELLYLSPAAEEVCASGPTQPPVPCLGSTVDEDRDRVVESWEGALQGEVTEIESRVIDKAGQQRWFRRSFHPVTDQAGRVIRIDGLMEDITVRRETLTRLERLATRDILTGLGNRTLWNQVVASTLAALEGTDKGAAVMLLDLNHFKVVNDNLGHSAGDEILIQVAGRLSETLRETDTIARLGGDEFAVLLPFQEAPLASAPKVAEKLNEVFQEPFCVDKEAINLSCAIGIACYPDQGEDLETLMSRADAAMYRAKRRQVPFCSYEAEQDQPASDGEGLLTELRRGLQEGQFEIHYQPIVNLGTGRVTSVEALVRWRKEPDRLVYPDEFIPLASQTGVIKDLTAVVLRQSLHSARYWCQAGYPVPVSVNVPPVCFQSDALLATIDHVLAETEQPGSSLWLEITEEHLMAQTDRLQSVCQALTERGIRIVIDDFGTGYSSLPYLKRLPLHCLKVDRSFVSDLHTDENDQSITHAIIQLGESLGLEVVAEGVENPETLALLTGWHCDGAQGYHLARPQASAEFLQWLEDRTPPEANHPHTDPPEAAP